MSMIVKRCMILVCAGLLFLAPSVAVSANGAPVIEVFKIERVKERGMNWLQFTWKVRNVDRVTFLEDGRPAESRIQLSDGSFGWPADMPGAYKIGTNSGSFTLIARNSKGKVSAVGRYTRGVCYAWNDPPGTHWSRCRRGGVIARNLSADRPRVASCTIEGVVTSRIGFTQRVRRRPNDPSSGTDIFRLNRIAYAEVGASDNRPIRLTGRGTTRRYKVSGLKGGRSYKIMLPWSWQGRPGEVRVRCPATGGRSVVVAGRLHAVGFRYEY